MAVLRRIHDRGCHRIHQNALADDLLRQRFGKCGYTGLARGIGRHPGPRPRFKCMPCSDVDDPAAGAAPNHRADGGATAEIASDEICLDHRHEPRLMGLGKRAHSEAASDVDRGPEIGDTVEGPRYSRLVSEITVSNEHYALIAALGKALAFRSSV